MSERVQKALDRAKESWKKAVKWSTELGAWALTIIGWTVESLFQALKYWYFKFESRDSNDEEKQKCKIASDSAKDKIKNWWKKALEWTKEAFKWWWKMIWNGAKWVYHLVDAWDKKIWDIIIDKEIKKNKWKNSNEIKSEKDKDSFSEKVKKVIRDNTTKLMLVLSALSYWWYQAATHNPWWENGENKEKIEITIDDKESNKKSSKSIDINLEDVKSIKEKPIDLHYKEINAEHKVSIDYPENNYSVEWRILRCLRRASITDAVEDRYGIPRWLLMALMAQEWRWDPTVINQKKSKDPNKTCDWWAGLIHMQAKNAKDFWLKTMETYNEWMIDYQHWEELEKAKAQTHNNLAKLSELDDRFNPVLSVDASARFLLNWYKKSDWTDARIKAINTYAWRWMDDYGYAVIVYRQTIASIRWFELPKFSKEIEKVKKWEWAALVNKTPENTKITSKKTQKNLNALQPKIDNKVVSYDEYMNYMKWQCDNYWLEDYISYDKAHPYNIK